MPPSRSDALKGVRVALLESRMGGEMADLIRRFGGIPCQVPSLRESPLDCAEAVTNFLRLLEAPQRRMVVFLTGAGATAVFHEADRQGRLQFLLESLSRATLVCRGPKPTAVLKRVGLAPAVSAADPYTSSEVLDALSRIDLKNIEATLVHYGERNEALSGELRARGARLHELCVYEWLMPDDIRPMKDLIQGVIASEVDAVVFTSQIQARHLLRVATEIQLVDRFVDALKKNVVVAVVGPICRAALVDSGIIPQVVPDNPKMVPLITALAEHCSARCPT
jgi:uroporphyrinogen-III synthase